MAVGSCFIAGALVGLLDPRLSALPHRFGYYVAAASLLAGIAFGIRGAAVPIAATVAFGLMHLLEYHHHPGDEGLPANVVLFVVLVPAVFAGIALSGALLRAGTLAFTRGAGRRLDHPR
jgi:hypothetical protein